MNKKSWNSMSSSGGSDKYSNYEIKLTVFSEKLNMGCESKSSQK